MKKVFFLVLISLASMAQNKEFEMVKGLKVYHEVDKNAVFALDPKELKDFLSSNVQYPGEAQKKNISGAIKAKLLVDADGQIKKATITNSLGDACDEEVMRIIKLMPNWVPAQKNGEKVASYVDFSVNFRLEDTKSCRKPLFSFWSKNHK